MKDAKKSFTRLKKHFPEIPEAGYFLSLIALQEKEYPRSLQNIKHALSKDPSNPQFICQLGNLYRHQENLDAAIEQYQKAIALDDQMLEPLIHLGMCLRKLSDLDGAIQAYKKAIEIKEDVAETHNNLGNVYLLKNDIDAARQCFERAIENNQGFSGAYHNLGRTYLMAGLFEPALKAFRQAVQLQPENILFITDLSHCIGQFHIKNPDKLFEHDLVRCLEIDRVDGGSLGRVAGLYLVEHSPIKELIEHNSVVNKREELDNNYKKILNNKLLFTLLIREQVCNPELEILLTRFRAWILNRIVNGEENSPDIISFLFVLSHQCFINEYVYSETRQENACVKLLEQQLTSELTARNVNVAAILIFSCYRPLISSHDIARLLEKIEMTDSGLKQVIIEQITEPKKENKLRMKITSLSGKGDEVSGIVRQQYEENPYPRWLQVDHPQPVTLFEHVVNLFPSAVNYLSRDNSKLKVLVAGCGTGLQPIRNARRFRDAKITGIDLSSASLAYAKRMTQKLKLTNIRYYQGNILELDKLTDRFNFIECFGVLHHMQDPLAGWQCLVNKLDSGGCMRIGLYSYRARAAIRAARELIKTMKFTDKPDDIRNCRQAILALDENHPAYNIRFSPDFYTMSECRDLIFHVHEHQLDIPFIISALDKFNLRFLGFEFSDNITISNFKKHNPGPSAEQDINLWHEYEDKYPDTFASQYVFWVTA